MTKEQPDWTLSLLTTEISNDGKPQGYALSYILKHHYYEDAYKSCPNINQLILKTLMLQDELLKHEISVGTKLDLEDTSRRLVMDFDASTLVPMRTRIDIIKRNKRKE